MSYLSAYTFRNGFVMAYRLDHHKILSQAHLPADSLLQLEESGQYTDPELEGEILAAQIQKDH